MKSIGKIWAIFENKKYRVAIDQEYQIKKQKYFELLQDVQMWGSGVTTRQQAGNKAPPPESASQSSRQIPKAAEAGPSQRPQSAPLDEESLEFFTQYERPTHTTFNGNLLVSTTTLMQLRGPSGISMAQHLPAFRRQLDKILEKAVSKARPHEHLQLAASCRHNCEQYISTQFFRADDAHGVSRLMAAINRSIHSNAKWMIDDEIEVTVKHVRNPPKTVVARGGHYADHTSSGLAVHERKSIVEIKNTDNMCLPRSIAVIKYHKLYRIAKAKNTLSDAELEKMEIFQKNVKDSKCTIQTFEAVDICTQAGISENDPCGDAEIQAIENALEIYIKVVAHDLYGKIIYDGVKSNLRKHVPVTDDKVYFILRQFCSATGEHHVHPIVNHKGFFKNPRYCLYCNVPHKTLRSHICRDIVGWCYSCWDRDCKADLQFFKREHCGICDTRFKSLKCKKIHVGQSVCKDEYFCPSCKEIIPRKKLKKRRLTPSGICYETDSNIRARHVCMKKCQLCHEKVDGVFHKCFLQKVPFKNASDKLLFYDIETDLSSGVHKPVYCHIMWYDPSTGTWLEKSFGVPTCPDVRKAVGEFLFSKKFTGYTMLAHNMKAFDGCFLMQYLGENGLKATPILAGRKIMSLEIKTLKIRVIDSLNFLPMPLAALEEAWELQDCGKGYFPHFFTRPENYNYKGDLPPMEAYGHNGMKPAARKEFMKWYEEVRKSDIPIKFDFQRDIAMYCRQDVVILKEACLAFKNLLMQLTEDGCDPFCYTTLASVASAIFKALYLQEKTIAAVPPNGYADIQNFSSVALEWLEWMRVENDRSEIKHIANSALGEANIGGYRVDGIDTVNKVAYEFNGCFFHGCQKCFPDRNQLNKALGKTFVALREATEDRAFFLEKENWTVETIWECEWNQMKAENPEIQHFVDQNKHRLTPMSPFDAFFGGRVEVFKMVVNDDRRMHYEDVTSLYPFINCTKRYPIGHPEVILNGFGDLTTICDRYFGFIKCQILPPQKLYIPVLPGKFGIDQKLLFALCRTCAEERRPEIRCTHKPEERVLTGTWFTEEVKKAVEMGYSIEEVMGVYHFEETSTDLFAPYIRLFYRQKLMASGIPSNCKTAEDLENYIKEVEEREKISLKKEDFVLNCGMRQLAKLLINSLWGKFGLRRNLPSTQFCTSIEEIGTLLNDPTLEVLNIIPMHEEMALVTTKKISVEHYEINNHANVYIAAITTAWGRLELLKHLEFLGPRAVYADTDSGVYIACQDDPTKNLQRGSFLGDLTSELKPDDLIKDFQAGGPKSYAYRTELGDEVLKIKGFGMNFTNMQAFTHDSMKEVVLNFMDICDDDDGANESVKISRIGKGKERTIKNLQTRQEIFDNYHGLDATSASAVATPTAISVFNPRSIARSKTWELLSKPEQKLYTVNYDKRIVTENFDTFPFGYIF